MFVCSIQSFLPHFKNILELNGVSHQDNCLLGHMNGRSSTTKRGETLPKRGTHSKAIRDITLSPIHVNEYHVILHFPFSGEVLLPAASPGYIHAPTFRKVLGHHCNFGKQLPYRGMLSLEKWYYKKSQWSASLIGFFWWNWLQAGYSTKEYVNHFL